MTASSPPTSQLTLTGVPVVPGVAYAPVIRPGQAPSDNLDALPEVDSPARAAESARFTAAAAAVAARLRDRAQQATGAAAEVLAATAGLAQDRAWLAAAEKRIAEGTPAPRATVAAVAQFIDLFTQIGGLMAERVTDLRDIRDRVVAELLGLPEPGVPRPARPSILCAQDLAPADTAGLDPDLIVGLG
jgi:phosphotransferase system enzyme I (PtsI)